MVPEFIVTGTGRSGTGFTAAFLTALGIPTGHEEVLNPYYPYDANDLSRDWPEGLRGDASWLAVPHLAQIKSLDSSPAIIHVVRNPLHVMRSMVGIGWLSRIGIHKAYEEFAIRHLPEIYHEWDGTRVKGEILQRCAVFYDHWIQEIGKFEPTFWKLEDLSRAIKARSMVNNMIGEQVSYGQIVSARESVPQNLNARPREENLQWEHLPDKLIAYAQMFGYLNDEGKEIENGQ